MRITDSQIVAWHASAALRDWFLIRFPDGDGKYQDVLNALADEDRPDDAHWLMDRVGTNAWEELDVSTLDAPKHVFAAGKLSVGASLCVSGWVRAGRGIEADKGLRADLGIVAGWSIRVGGSIRSNGEIKAGGRIDAGRNIAAAGAITSAAAIVGGGDISAGKDISAGIAHDSMSGALEALHDDDADAAQGKWIALKKLWSAIGGSEDLWEAFGGDRSAFRLEAVGDICAGTSIVCARTITAGDSILAGEGIECGETLQAGGNVTAARSINGGMNITVKGALEAGADIVASWIHARGSIKAKGDVLFSQCLESDSHISVRGSVRADDNSRSADVSAHGDISVGGEIRCTGDIRAASIEAGGSLWAGRCVRTEGDLIVASELTAGRYLTSRLGSICAGQGIKAGGAIQAARSIQASKEIVAGEDCGVFAATGLKFSDWRLNGRVIAEKRPENLISGYWAVQ